MSKEDELTNTHVLDLYALNMKTRPLCQVQQFNSAFYE